MTSEFRRYKFVTRWRDNIGSHDEPLCIGERIKKGTFRPCLTKAIPFSSIVGALRASLGIGYEYELIAAGYIEEYDSIEYSVLAPYDAALGVVKPPAPITFQYLSGAWGWIYIGASNQFVRDALDKAGDEFIITMGAMKSTGFGRCLLVHEPGDVSDDVVRGKLRTRIPEKLAGSFGISEIIKPVYGYLFEPTDIETGIYVRSLYEGSEVDGYSFLVERGDES